MPYIVTVMFARPASGKYNFNMDHYLNVHTELATKVFGPLGLRTLNVVDYRDDESQPYLVGNVMEWESVEAFEREKGSAAVGSVFADLANVTDLPPIFIQGEIKKTLKYEPTN